MTVEGFPQLHEPPRAAGSYSVRQVSRPAALSEALDKVRKQEHARLSGRNRKFIKGQKYALLSHPENLTGEARKNLKLLLAANRPTSA